MLLLLPGVQDPFESVLFTTYTDDAYARLLLEVHHPSGKRSRRIVIPPVPAAIDEHTTSTTTSAACSTFQL
jgi:hypothetical protein